MANGRDDDAPGAWEADLEARLRKMETRFGSGRLTIGRWVLSEDSSGNLVATNTVSDETTTLT